MTITSADENTFVDGLYASGHGHIGLRQPTPGSDFQWVTGEAVSYTNWHAGEPNNSSGVEDCVHQYEGGTWNDIGCTGLHSSHYVIEYDGPFPDTDGDGTADALDADDDNDGVDDGEDAFPTDATEQTDTDGDGTGDNADSDDDGDGVNDDEDAFPKDKNESVDTDGDGTGDNADSDDDGDGVDDEDDAFPLNAAEHTDTDGDGTGDNADTDDDDDGVDDDEDAYPKDPNRHAEPDEDDRGPLDEEDDAGVADTSAGRDEVDAVEAIGDLTLANTGASIPVLLALGLNLVTAGMLLCVVGSRQRRHIRPEK